LFKKRKEQGKQAASPHSLRRGKRIERCRRKSSVDIVETVKRESHLLQVVAAPHSPCGFPCHVNGRQQKSNQQTDDRNDNEQFDKRKSDPSRVRQAMPTHSPLAPTGKNIRQHELQTGFKMTFQISLQKKIA